MIKVGHAIVELVQESLISQRVDLIVNPANTYLWMKQGIPGLLKREGGDQIEREAMGKGPIALGDVVLTGAGSLPCSRIAHAAIMGQDLKVHTEAIRSAVAKVIALAEAARFTTIAMPPLTSAKPQPSEMVADAMFAPLLEALVDVRSIRLVRMCLPDMEELAHYRAVLRGFFGG